MTSGRRSFWTGGRSGGLRSRWNLRHFGRLVERLTSTPEADGTLLDRTALVLLFEGGATSAHSVIDMTAAVAGRPDVLSLGKHERLVGAHPPNVIQSVMHAVGVEVDYGEVPARLDELLA